MSAVLVVGVVAPAEAASPSGSSAVVKPVTRVFGADRIDTAVAASKTAFPDGGAKGAVIARSDGFADALAGAPLAAQRGPMLLTSSAHLDIRVRAELVRVLKPGVTVFVLGTTDVISAEVEQSLKDLGHPVQRLGGTDRYTTAAAIARQVQPKPLDSVGCLFTVATGRDFADGLSAATVAGGPILLTNGTSMPAATAAAIQACRTGLDGTVDTRIPLHLTAVGGPAAAALTQPQSTWSGEATTLRTIAGNDRYETSAQALLYAGGNGEEPARPVLVATGSNFPDALVGSTLAHCSANSAWANRLLPVALVRPTQLPTNVAARLGDFHLALNGAYVMGGPDVVSDEVLGDVADTINH